MKTDYEIMLLTKADLSEDDRAAAVKRAQDAVAKSGGSWGEVNDWGRRTTAYPIQKLPDAFYQLMTFSGDGDTVDEAVRVLRITEGVLRVMATKQVPPYPEEAELETVSDEEFASAGSRGGGSKGGRGRRRD